MQKSTRNLMITIAVASVNAAFLLLAIYMVANYACGE